MSCGVVWCSKCGVVVWCGCAVVWCHVVWSCVMCGSVVSCSVELCGVVSVVWCRKPEA